MSVEICCSWGTRGNVVKPSGEESSGKKTPGIKGTENTLPLLSLGSYISERIGDCFGTKRLNLNPLPETLCSHTSVTWLPDILRMPFVCFR